MTPMVDLGFLLLTFFVLTTTMNTPNTMPVVVPPKITEKDKDVEPPKISEDKVITLFVSRGKIYYYAGLEKKLQVTDFSPKTGVRNVLLERRAEIEANYGKDEMIVIIKMIEDAQYRDFVDILDEMAVINQKKYALVDITPEEKEIVEDYRKTMEKTS